MAWDPAVLRKYNTTGHFRLINQVRSELKDNPLVRPKDGQSVGEANLSRALSRALEGRGSSQRYRRNAPAAQSIPAAPLDPMPEATPAPSRETDGTDLSDAGAASFRDRLNAIELR